MIVAAMVNLLDAIGCSVLLVVVVGEVIKGVGRPAWNTDRRIWSR